MTITITAGAVAWYGAIVATGSVLVAVYLAWRDRARLKVVADANMRIRTVGGPHDDDETYIVIDVANVGRRAVHLQQLPWFTVKGKKGGLAVKGDWGPSSTVEEGRSVKLLTPQSSLPVGLDRLKRVCVKDETGKVWKGKINNR